MLSTSSSQDFNLSQDTDPITLPVNLFQYLIVPRVNIFLWYRQNFLFSSFWLFFPPFCTSKSDYIFPISSCLIILNCNMVSPQSPFYAWTNPDSPAFPEVPHAPVFTPSGGPPSTALQMWFTEHTGVIISLNLLAAILIIILHTKTHNGWSQSGLMSLNVIQYCASMDWYSKVINYLYDIVGKAGGGTEAYEHAVRTLRHLCG